MPSLEDYRSAGVVDPLMPSDSLPIAIVGAGFSGTLLAVNRLRLGQRFALIERDADKLARGQAFGTEAPEHLLNVRAANMSAFPDDPGHFVRWMGFSTAEQTNRFVPRRAYGRYLQEQLTDALAASEGRGEVRHGEAVAARFDKDDIAVPLADGGTVHCSKLVLALGNFAPGTLQALAGVDNLVLRHPWDLGDLPSAMVRDVVLIGTGLTAIDVVLSLARRGFAGRITALSRRGLRPRAHVEAGPIVAAANRPEARGSWLLHAVRQRANELGWRAAVDELRPHTQDLWRAHSRAQQASFLRHLRPYWDVHRHRLPPSAARLITKWEESGRLRFIPGKLTSAKLAGAGVNISYRPRGLDEVQRLCAGAIVNCTGPDGNLGKIPDNLIGDLLEQGRIRPDAHRLGLDVDHLSRVRDSSGTTQDRIFAIGPITKGEAWEIVAVPDIRRQVWTLARLLANEHWVGGEGL